MIISCNFVSGSGSFDNTVPFEDAETQVVCLAGETQVLDFDCETQAVENLDCAEDCTQLCEDFDTEVVVNTDDEGTKKTEVLSETEELSDVDSMKKIGIYPVEPENKMQTAMHKQGGECKDTLSTEECNTGLKNLVIDIYFCILHLLLYDYKHLA